MAHEKLGNGSYTPGPWRVGGLDNGPGERHLHIGAIGRILSLASMNPHHVDTPANAALIAAAPDLYEAMARAHGFLVAICGNVDPLANPVIEKARAALKSASTTGEA